MEFVCFGDLRYSLLPAPLKPKYATHFTFSVFRISHVSPNSKAGAEIIGQNMRGGDSAALNVPRSEVPKSPGQIIFQELNSLVMSCRSPRIIILSVFYATIHLWRAPSSMKVLPGVVWVWFLTCWMRPWSQEGGWRCRAGHRMPGKASFGWLGWCPWAHDIPWPFSDF